MSHVLQIEFEQEDDGRWIADIPALPGVIAYGASRKDARSQVEARAVRPLADRLENGNDSAARRSVCSSRMNHWKSARVRQLLAALLAIA